MPRPADTYTHDQFQEVNTFHLGGSVQCRHCQRWQGSARVLSRKKAHLTACPEYVAWRAAGHGQELAPPNPYNAASRRVSSNAHAPHDSSSSLGSSSTGTMQRQRSTLDLNKYFDEFFDDSLGQKCARVRCQSCGLVRAKNATRQAEHLIQCKEFLSTTEGAELWSSGSLALHEQAEENPPTSSSTGLIINHLHDSGPNSPYEMILQNPSARRSRPQTPQLAAPSLAKILLFRAGESLTKATHHQFLSHAGCGVLAEDDFDQWLAQIGYISRSLVSFTGALIGKIRIPNIADLEHNATFRCLDLLCSAVNNAKKELEFLEATKRKFGLDMKFREPKPPTQGFIDLFNSASCPSATLLEGMVMLWAIEILFHNSFSYAGTFLPRTAPTPQRNSYSLPHYSLPSDAVGSSYGGQNQPPKNGHVAALREAFIENWKSENFGRFVHACKFIVDELATTEKTRDIGEKEIAVCERVFNQAIWLWSQMFPEVGGAGEQDELCRQDAPDNGIDVT